MPCFNNTTVITYTTYMIHFANQENQICSQQGEDGIIKAVFDEIGTTNRVAVEFGALDGPTDNTLLLKKQGWKVHQWNGEKLTPNIKQHFVTAENINQIWESEGVPDEPDLLSIDIDYNDYWVWQALIHRPRLIVIEHNASIPPTEARVVPYDPNRGWDGTNFFGASLLALNQLAQKKNYSLIYVESQGVNAFFIRTDCLTSNIKPLTPTQAYQSPKYGPNNGGHPQSSKEMPLI